MPERVAGTASRQKQFILTDKDAEQFSQMLVEKFPTIRFVDNGEWSDHEFEPSRSRPGDQLKVPYRPSLAGQRRLIAWLEPQHWEPLWLPRGSDKYYKGPKRFYIANQPDSSFYFESSRCGDPPGWSYYGGRLWARYDLDDKAHKRFLGQVFRLLDKMTPGDVDRIDRVSGELKWTGKCHYGIGTDAMEWCRAEPRRRLNEDYRPANSPREPFPG